MTMTELLTDDIRSHIGRSGPPARVTVTRVDIQKYSAATGQTRQAFLDGDEAPPLFHFNLGLPVLPLDQLRPDGLADDPLIPELPLKRIMAGTCETTFHRPIRAGDELVVTRWLDDIYEKQGGSGPLIFVVLGLKIETAGGEPVLDELISRIAR